MIVTVLVPRPLTPTQDAVHIVERETGKEIGRLVTSDLMTASEAHSWARALAFAINDEQLERNQAVRAAKR